MHGSSQCVSLYFISLSAHGVARKGYLCRRGKPGMSITEGLLAVAPAHGAPKLVSASVES